MSWFTAPASTGQPACPRCKKPNFVALIRNTQVKGDYGDIAIFNCGGCPIPTTQRAKG